MLILILSGAVILAGLIIAGLLKKLGGVKVQLKMANQVNANLMDAVAESNERGKQNAKFERMSKDERDDWMVMHGGLRDDDTHETD